MVAHRRPLLRQELMVSRCTLAMTTHTFRLVRRHLPVVAALLPHYLRPLYQQRLLNIRVLSWTAAHRHVSAEELHIRTQETEVRAPAGRRLLGEASGWLLSLFPPALEAPRTLRPPVVVAAVVAIIPRREERLSQCGDQSRCLRQIREARNTVAKKN